MYNKYVQQNVRPKWGVSRPNAPFAGIGRFAPDGTFRSPMTAVNDITSS